MDVFAHLFHREKDLSDVLFPLVDALHFFRFVYVHRGTLLQVDADMYVRQNTDSIFCSPTDREKNIIAVTPRSSFDANVRSPCFIPARLVVLSLSIGKLPRLRLSVFAGWIQRGNVCL